MNKFLLVALILSLTALGYLAFKNQSYAHRGTRPAITDSANHNNQMNECIKLALEKHPIFYRCFITFNDKNKKCLLHQRRLCLRH